MREVGLAATEFGPDGFLPADPGVARVAGGARPQRRRRLRPGRPARPGARPGARVRPLLEAFVEAARRRHAGPRRRDRADGYDDRPVLDERRLAHAAAQPRPARRAGRRARRHARAAPARRHDGREPARRSSGCSTESHRPVPGHRPPADRRRRPGRRWPATTADRSRTSTSRTSTRRGRRVRAGRLGYTEAVREGMYRPLGQGDVDIAAIVVTLRGRRLRRLVRPGAGHHPRPGRPPARPRAAGRRPGQRRAPAVRGRDVLNVPRTRVACRPSVRMSEQTVDALEGNCLISHVAGSHRRLRPGCQRLRRTATPAGSRPPGPHIDDAAASSSSALAA